MLPFGSVKVYQTLDARVFLLITDQTKFEEIQKVLKAREDALVYINNRGRIPSSWVTDLIKVPSLIHKSTGARDQDLVTQDGYLLEAMNVGNHAGLLAVPVTKAKVT